MHRSKKRALMGIGTLIIFIATILVAAVAAGVLISTSGVLQQRALITGQESRKKITNAVELISITARGSPIDERLNEFETLIRLDAGSDPLQMKRFDLSFIGENTDAAASLMHNRLNDVEEYPAAFNERISDIIMTDTIINIRDLDDDGINDQLLMYTPDNASYYLIFNMSSAGYYRYNLTMNLYNLSSYAVTFNDLDNPIIGQDGFYYGFFHIVGANNINRSINTSIVQFNLTSNAYTCTMATVPPEERFCYVVMHTSDLQDDIVLNDGEVFELQYKLRYHVIEETNITSATNTLNFTIPASEIDNRLGLQEDFRFIYSAEKGRLTQAQARTPDVVLSRKVPLWPVG
jgi:archaellin